MKPLEIIPSQDAKIKAPSALASALQCKCPRCRTGNMFIEKNPYKLRRTMKMKETCDVCGQSFDLEVGFYYGSGYVSYALAIAFSVFFLVIYWLTIGISIHDNRLIYWLIINAIFLIALQPVLMRLARSIWLSFFVAYDKNWRFTEAKRPERTNNSQKNNW